MREKNVREINLTKENICFANKISVEDNVIAAECTLLFDVDKYFGTTIKKDNTSSLKDAVKEALRLGCEVYDENGEIIFSQWDGWNGDYPDIKKKAFPVADMEMVKKAQNFLKKTSTYENWCSFKNSQFHKWIGKAEWLHSDRWSAAYDWVYDGKFADVDIPDDIINCLVEEWEKSMGLKVGI